MAQYTWRSFGLAPLAALALGSISASAAPDSEGTVPPDAAAGAAQSPAFAAQFEPFARPPAQVTLPPGAVDLTTFEPPLERNPVLRTLGAGVASYYGKRFHGRRTANGERFNMNAMTAAHKTLPFGTRVRVTNPRNGRTVTVRINDRGPFIRGRTIDLSRAAARKLGIVSSGHGRVKLDVVAR